MTHGLEVVATAAAGAVTALALQTRALAAPPAWALRTNVSGKEVPAVLGGLVVLGGAAGAVVASTAWDLAGTRRSGAVVVAVIVVLGLLGAAGRFDDGRGDERPRGFAGHLRAGRLTGGVVKILAGGAAGAIAAALVHPDGPGLGILTALAVPLAANLFNLLDRAPGRTGKAALLAGIPLLVFGDATWALAAAGAFGALTAVLPADLGERGMLGDAGANPIGGLVGLGLGLSLDVVPLGIAVAALLALNAASEVWSFSKVIEATPALRALDRIGRK